MKQLIKAICLMLALSTVATILISCSDTSDKPTFSQDSSVNTSTDEQSEETTKILPDLPPRDFDGYTFRVITKGHWAVHWKTKDIYAEALTADPITDELFNRITKTGEHFNLPPKEIEEPENRRIGNECGTRWAPYN